MPSEQEVRDALTTLVHAGFLVTSDGFMLSDAAMRTAILDAATLVEDNLQDIRYATPV